MAQPTLEHPAHKLVVRTRVRGAAVLLAVLGLLAPGCGTEAEPPEAGLGVDVSPIVQTCTAQNVAGFPYSGVVCGGSVIDGCSKGALYSCQKGARGTMNNCTLAQTCAIGCLTGSNSTPVTLNTSQPSANDACFTGSAPLTLSTTNTLGGNYVTMTATLTQSHSPYAVVNLQGTSSVVPPLCNVPLLLPSGTNSVSFVEPTGTVAQATNVPLNVLLSFNDSSGKGRNLVSVPTTLTLNPGGSVTAPPLASFRVTDGGGADISTIQGGTNGFAQGTLSMPAPVGGASVTVTSNPASAFTTTGNFTILTGCTSNSDWGVLTATSSATSNLAATVTATTGAGAALTKNVTITPPALAMQSLTLTPSTVKGGTSLSATINLNRNVLASDASSTVSVRLSPGLISNTPLATFPGCTGSPACTGPITVPVGSTSTSFTISTQPVTTEDMITVSANSVWSNSSPAQQLTITP